jgi:DNA-directed RNA polymerase subunit RPC12/RpoP
MIRRTCSRCRATSDHLFDIYCPECGYRLGPVRVKNVPRDRLPPED